MFSMIKNHDDYERFLYGDEFISNYDCEDELLWIKSVESAVGFKLFAWQKMMILGMTSEYGRRTGKSTTWALQKLRGEMPIDVSWEAMMKKTPRQRFNYKLLKEIAEKLDEHNVVHAPVCRTRKEWNEKMREMPAHLRSGLTRAGIQEDWYTLSDNV